ncbi:ABC transporter permease [Pararhodobacter aggregans]|uniref:ABC transporter permease n=1 Tax=Pararhodobacter aggregans TaxID=404875 RepID=A0A2T7UQS7_9RHOB|nr:ABC transporter permease [Pararhodobacter aggregans]PTX01692.1 peptide/nickel transport system permease protein [Pararhodobacter aggregans]PVE46941.1 ABC transporter permease [Pararhodobacter aggregans]
MKPIRRRFPWAFLAKRVAYGALAMLAIAIINFFLLKLAPGDAAEALAGQAGTADPAYIAQLRAQFGLDQPLLSQLWAFLVRLATLDLGYSYVFNERVSVLIFSRMPATLMLMGAAIVIAVIGGIVFGVTAARYANRWPDRVISFVALLLYGTPPYWIGLMMILIFAVTLGWTPTSGMENVLAFNTGWDRVADIAHHLILPALAQSIFYLAIYIRLVRAGMLEVLSLDFIRVARAKGISERRLSYRHALRNAVLPLVTVVGTNVGNFLGGAVLTETVFSWPGVGRLMFDAMFQRDLNLLLSILVLSSFFVILANLIVDLLYAVINPTVELK